MCITKGINIAQKHNNKKGVFGFLFSKLERKHCVQTCKNIAMYFPKEWSVE